MVKVNRSLFAWVLLIVVLSAAEVVGATVISDFSNISPWNRAYGASSMYNDGRDVATLISGYGDAGSWWLIKNLNIDLQSQDRLQIRARKNPECQCPVYLTWNLGGENPSLYWQSPQVEVGRIWKTYAFNFTGAPFAVKSATLGLHTGAPYPSGALDVDFMLVSSASEPVYDNEPAGYRPPLSPKKRGLQVFDPGDFKNQYRTLYNEATARLKDSPKPGGRLYNGGGFFVIDRGISKMRFSKTSGVCTEAIIRGYRMNKGCRLANLVVVDKSGRCFEQRFGKGKFSARTDDRKFYIEGSFIPEDAQGNKFPARFVVTTKIWRSSGLVLSRYAVAGNAKPVAVRKLSVENTLGKTPRTFENLYMCNHWPGGLETYVEVSDDSAQINRDRQMYKNLGHPVNRMEFVDVSGGPRWVMDSESLWPKSYVASRPSKPKYFSFKTSDQCRSIPMVEMALVTDITAKPGAQGQVSHDMYAFETLPEGSEVTADDRRWISLKVYSDPELKNLVGESERAYARDIKSGCWRAFYFGKPLEVKPDTTYYVNPSMGDDDPRGYIAFYITAQDHYADGRLFDPDNANSEKLDAAFRVHRVAMPPKSDRAQVKADKAEFATWSDGYLGFQVMPLDWIDARVDAAVENDRFGDRYLSCQTDSFGCRYANVTPINVPDGTMLVAGNRIGQAFALMPFKKFRPWPEIPSSSNWIANIMYPAAGHTACNSDLTKAEIDIKAMARAGVGNMAQVVALRPDHDAFYNSVIELCNRYCIRSLVYQDQFAGSPGYDLAGRPMNEEDKKALASGFHAWCPEVPKDYPMLQARENPRSQDYWLAQLDNIQRTYTKSIGFYFDDCVLMGCDNVRHGHGDAIYYPVEENMEFFESYRNLLDSFGPGKRMRTHSWGRVVCPVDALSDGTQPGEQIGNIRRSSLAPAEENIPFSSLLSGCQAVWIGDRAYQFVDPYTGEENPRIFEQALRKAGVVCQYYFPNPSTNSESNNTQGREISFTPAEMAMYGRYMFPQVIFDTGTSELHHPMDIDYSRYARVSGKDVDALIYSRPGECLLVAVNLPHNEKRATVRLSVDAFGPRGVGI